jgi:ferredoxin
MKKITKVEITPGCVSCGTCMVICNQVFELNGIATVKPDADVEKHADRIREAAEMCPVHAIKVTAE